MVIYIKLGMLLGSRNLMFFFFFFCDTRDQIGYVDMYGY